MKPNTPFASWNALSVTIIAVVMLFAMVSCGKDPEPVRFSILGDSYSTFEGYVDPESNDVWSYYENINVTDVGQMWWRQLADSTGWQVEKNNSFSGSLICDMDYQNYYGPHSFLRRMNDLGNPDVIFIFGGTNDVWNEAPLGEYVFANWTDEQLCTFRPALACLFYSMKCRYGKAKLYFMVDLSLDDAYIASIHRIAQCYGVECIDLYYVEKDWNHPTIEGQTIIAQQVLEILRQDAVIF